MLEFAYDHPEMDIKFSISTEFINITKGTKVLLDILDHYDSELQLLEYVQNPFNNCNSFFIYKNRKTKIESENDFLKFKKIFISLREESINTKTLIDPNITKTFLNNVAPTYYKIWSNGNLLESLYDTIGINKCKILLTGPNHRIEINNPSVSEKKLIYSYFLNLNNND